MDDIQAAIDDHTIKTISIRSSAFVKPIRNEVNDWFDTVNRMNLTLEEWAKVQVQWLYFMPIFSSKDIIAQMPEEGTLFNVSGIGTFDVVITSILETRIFRTSIRLSKRYSI